MISKMADGKVMGGIGMPTDGRPIPLKDVSHIAGNFHIQNICEFTTGETPQAWLTAEIQILDTEPGRRLKDMIWKHPDPVVFRTACKAQVSQEARVTCCQEERPVYVIIGDLEFTGVHAVRKEDASC